VFECKGVFMEFAVVIASVIKLGCKICRPDTVELVLHLRKKIRKIKIIGCIFFFLASDWKAIREVCL